MWWQVFDLCSVLAGLTVKENVTKTEKESTLETPKLVHSVFKKAGYILKV